MIILRIKSGQEVIKGINVYNNPCFRCGKERVFVRSWEEKVGNSVVVTREMACPDNECQDKVDEDNAKRIKKIKDAQARRTSNIRARGRNRTGKK